MTAGSTEASSITAIIPTLGRADMLERCLASLQGQSLKPAEVIVVHCGHDPDTAQVVLDPRWAAGGMAVRYVAAERCNAVVQRNHGMSMAAHDYLLFLDDDVELEADFVTELLQPMLASARVGATMGQAIGHAQHEPPLLWRCYRWLCVPHELRLAPGRVVGAAVPNGFPRGAVTPVAVEWLAGGLMLVRRNAFQSVAGFAPYFTGPAPGEDVDFGYRLSRQWTVLWIPSARAWHHQAASGRSLPADYHYEWVRGRFATMRRAMGRSRPAALAHVALWAVFQTLSEIAALRKGWRSGLPAIWAGRWSGVASCAGWEPPHA